MMAILGTSPLKQANNFSSEMDELLTAQNLLGFVKENVQKF